MTTTQIKLLTLAHCMHIISVQSNRCAITLSSMSGSGCISKI